MTQDILVRLTMATVASCSCMTKTYLPEHHQDICLYRVICDAIEEIEKLRSKND